MQHTGTRPATSPERPLSVTIVAVLAALGGALAILGVLAGSVIHGLDSLDPIEAVMVLAALAMSVLYLALAYGAWNLKPWGWPWGVFTGAATVALTTVVLVRGWADLMVDAPPLAAISLLVIVIAAVGLLIWFRPHVKAAFQRV